MGLPKSWRVGVVTRWGGREGGREGGRGNTERGEGRAWVTVLFDVTDILAEVPGGGGRGRMQHMPG